MKHSPFPTVPEARSTDPIILDPVYEEAYPGTPLPTGALPAEGPDEPILLDGTVDADLVKELLSLRGSLRPEDTRRRTAILAQLTASTDDLPD